MPRFSDIWPALAFVVVAACASIGLPTAQTFDQRAIVAQTSVTAIRNGATQLLIAQVITADDGQNVLTSTDAGVAGIAVARSLYAKACPPPPAGTAPVACTATAADQRLASVTAILNALQTYLTAQGAKP